MNAKTTKTAIKETAKLRPKKEVQAKGVNYIHGLHMPKTMPNNWVLKQIAFPSPEANFKPFQTIDEGVFTEPRISWRNQERIRRGCMLAGIDPKEVGLKDKRRPDEKYVNKMLKFSGDVKKETENLVAKIDRREKIEENMIKMEERIQKWREEEKKLKLKAKNLIPF
ncbi:hypothetical protein HDU92_003423 [Lobulomyces angularis]|nr:hypothetical protein HDU92_003423 [Lobulomyces angularis]